jgi:hypothetical protein
MINGLDSGPLVAAQVIEHAAPYANGVAAFSPGLDAPAGYPGFAMSGGIQPQRGCGPALCRAVVGRNPVGVEKIVFRDRTQRSREYAAPLGWRA